MIMQGHNAAGPSWWRVVDPTSTNRRSWRRESATALDEDQSDDRDGVEPEPGIDFGVAGSRTGSPLADDLAREPAGGAAASGSGALGPAPVPLRVLGTVAEGP
jgi:hypothetical protein